ncbi:acyltransferase family protein [Laribacter hongkongensis]|uniref:acyltransferase family protein n=1 Tax=Laribacter hongkongensis TaxID=168471 RepID=UPI001EFED699|nr:acyltransferase [Laribacter hongkongensis]MCG9096590.1 acyltransferase [Laribacter hongkongensis]
MHHQPIKEQKNMNRNEVLDYLRGLAVFMVLLAHWGTMGSNPPATASLLHLSVLPSSSGQDFISKILTNWTSFASNLWPLNINFASGGVLLFFLVSGFVIPMSVEKYSPLSFGIRRAFRLLPTLWVAIFFVLALNLILRKIGYANEQPFSISQIFANMFLVHDWFWIPHIDLGFWTLVVEVKFYIAMAALVVLSGRITLPAVAGLTAFLLFITVPFHDFQGTSDYVELLKLSDQSGYSWVFYLFRVLNNSTPYVIYMLIGTVIFLFQQNRIQAGTTFVACATLFALFATAFLIGPTGSAQLYYVSDGLKALTIFSCTVIINRSRYLSGRLVIFSFIFKFLGRISYSLYLIHGLFGMSLIYALWMWSGNINISMLIGGAFVFLITTLVNRFVEEPSQSIGSKIAKSVSSSPPPSLSEDSV